MVLSDGGREGFVPGLSTSDDDRLAADADGLWLIRSSCIRSFTELPVEDALVPRECGASLCLLALDESDGWAGLLGLMSYVGSLFFGMSLAKRR